MNPDNELFNAHFTDLCDDWRKNSDELIALVDAATDTLDYMEASEEAIREEIAAAVSGMEKGNPAVRTKYRPIIMICTKGSLTINPSSVKGVVVFLVVRFTYFLRTAKH